MKLKINSSYLRYNLLCFWIILEGRSVQLTSVADFQKFSGVAKGLSLPSDLDKGRVIDKYLAIFVDYTCFS